MDDAADLEEDTQPTTHTPTNYGGEGVDFSFGLPDTLDVAKGRALALKEIDAEIAETRRRLAQLEQAKAVLESLGGGPSSKSGQNLAALTYPNAARAVLLKAGKPLRIRQILTRMANGGRPVQSSAPYRTLYRVLVEHPKTFQNNDGAWQLAKRSDHAEWYDHDGELPPQTREEDE